MKVGAKAMIAALAAAVCVAMVHRLGGAQTGAADDLDSAIEKIAKENEASAKAQEAIREASDEADSLLTEYRGVQRRIEQLRMYNDQLEEELLDAQREEIESLRDQIERVTIVSRQIAPLMIRMVDALEEFVRLDVPFLPEEREARVTELRKLLGRADVGESEKFRRLMEAYQIENEYGRTIEAYRGTVDIEGQERNVDFLRVGRVALIYRTLDGQVAGRWDQKARKWQELTREYSSEIPKALRIARKQAAPDLIRLPIRVPEPGRIIEVPE